MLTLARCIAAGTISIIGYNDMYAAIAMQRHALFLFSKNNLTQNSYHVISSSLVVIFISENLPNSAPKVSGPHNNPRRSDTNTMDIISTALSVLLFDSSIARSCVVALTKYFPKHIDSKLISMKSI